MSTHQDDADNEVERGEPEAQLDGADENVEEAAARHEGQDPHVLLYLFVCLVFS